MLFEDDESDTDEPLLSGSGGASKDCTETELDSWGEVREAAKKSFLNNSSIRGGEEGGG